MSEITNNNLEIARRANDQARADFATWVMMAKLNGIDTLSAQAQTYLAEHKKLAAFPQATEREASETVIHRVYLGYYTELGGTGSPPDLQSVKRYPAMPAEPENNNVTPFRKVRKDAPPPKPARKMPVGLIFLALVVVVVTFNFLTRGTP